MGCFSSGESTQKSYTGSQKKWLDAALSFYGPMIGQQQKVYPGQRVAGFTPTQKAALGGTEGLMGQFGPNAQMPMFGETGDALKGILSGRTGAQPITPQQTQSYFKRAFEDPARYEFSEYTRPLIREEFAGPGFWGSGRAGAVTKAGQEMGNWLGTKRGELEWQTGETNRAIEEAKAQRTAGAIPLGMQYGQMPTQNALAKLSGAQGVFGLGSAEQQQNQNVINASMQRWAEKNNITDPQVLSVLMNLLGMSYSSGSTTGPGLGYNFLGGLSDAWTGTRFQ